MTDTKHTDSVEAVQNWLKEQGSAYNYVGDTEDLSSVCLDGRFDLEALIATLQATHSQQVEEAVRKERERIDAEVLSPLYEKINSFYEEKHDIVGRGALQIVFEEALQALTPNHQD